MRKLQTQLVDRSVLQCMEKNKDKLACHQPITTELCHSRIIRIENRMNMNAFRGVWAGVMFSKLLEAHEMHERSYDFSFLIFSTKL